MYIAVEQLRKKRHIAVNPSKETNKRRQIAEINKNIAEKKPRASRTKKRKIPEVEVMNELSGTGNNSQATPDMAEQQEHERLRKGLQEVLQRLGGSPTSGRIRFDLLGKFKKDGKFEFIDSYNELPEMEDIAMAHGGGEFLINGQLDCRFAGKTIIYIAEEVWGAMKK